MSQGHCVIVGNGPAANQAALTLREKAPDLRVTIIGQERVRYYKPHLLPDYVAGVIGEEELYVNPLEFYSNNDIHLRLGQRVVGVDLGQRHVILEHKETVPFDGLIFAAGGKPKIPEPLEPSAHLMLTLKTLADAEQWIEDLQGVESVLIVGGDLTSLVFTRALLTLGKKVSFVINAHSFWPLQFSSEIRDQVKQGLENRGVTVLDGRDVRQVDRVNDHALEVRIDGAAIRVGLVGAFYGLTPDVNFLARTGIDIDRGILVDEYLRTRHQDVYAAGDCAQVYHPGIRDYWVSIGHANARELGRIAALNLAGSTIQAAASPESIFRLDGVSVNLSWWMEF